MVIRSVGVGYHELVPNGGQAVKVPSGHYRLLHQMGKAKALATIMEKNVQSFIWKNIICKYGIPRVLVSDNGKQFDNAAFRDFCL